MAPNVTTIEFQQQDKPTEVPMVDVNETSYPPTIIQVPKLPSFTELLHLRTDKILLGTLRNGRLKVISPMAVEFTSEGAQKIAEAKELNEFGFGSNWTEALADLQRAITELYFTLEESQDALGSDMQKIWKTLQHKVLKR